MKINGKNVYHHSDGKIFVEGNRIPLKKRDDRYLNNFNEEFHELNGLPLEEALKKRGYI